jgi:hypothetical protein
MIKFYILFIFSILTFEVKAAIPCVNSGSSSDPIVAGDSCNSTPDFYQIELLEIGLCNNIDPTNPEALPNIASNCSKVFESPTLINVQISSSLIGTGLNGGNYTKPALGNYTYGYVKTSNKVSVKTTKYFTSDQIGDSDGGSSGPACWTIEGNNHSGINPSTSDPTVKCGSSPSAQFYNKIFEGMLCEVAYYCNLATYTIPSNSPNSYLYLTKNGIYTNLSNDELNNNVGVVTPNEMIIFYQFVSPLNITNDAQNLSVLFEVTNNLKVRNSPVSLKIRTFGFKMEASK